MQKNKNNENWTKEISTKKKSKEEIIRSTAEYNNESKFYVAQIFKRAQSWADDDKITDEFLFRAEKGNMSVPYNVKVPIIETNGVKREFLTNIPVDFDCVKERLIANKQFSEILDKNCLFFYSFVRITKEEFAKILLDIKATNALERYCKKLYDEREEDMKKIKFDSRLEADSKDYEQKEPLDADKVIKSFVKKN